MLLSGIKMLYPRIGNNHYIKMLLLSIKMLFTDDKMFQPNIKILLVISKCCK